MELQEKTLAQISKNGRGYYGIGASAVPFSEELYTYLRITDINDDGTLNMADLKSVADENAGDYLLEPNDIVFARTGASTGRNYFFDGSDGQFVYAGFLIKFALDEKAVNPRFIKYYCMSKPYWDWISAYNTGSTRGNINAQTLASMPISLPPRDYQDKVVSILDSIESKRKRNNEINNNLSEQIQAIYREDFDPTTHKPTGFLSDICHYSSERISISDLSVSTYFSTENMQPNKAGAVNATSLPTISQTTKCHKGDVLISNIRPYFKKIVYVSDECGCSTDVLCFVPNDSSLSAFLFSTVYADRFFDYMVAGSKGTKMPRGDKQQIMKYPVVVPSTHALISFSDTVKPMLETIANNRAENIRLADIRDALLPRLMSGELDVSELDI